MAIVVLVIAAMATAGWHFSSAVLVPDHSPWPPDATVEAVSSGRIVLSRNDDSDRPGVYGLDWQAGHAVVGPVIGGDADTVTRRLRDVRGYLVPGRKVVLDSDVYAGDPGQALGLPFSNVRVRGETGAMPAWEIPGRSRNWAIVVHGINGSPQEGLNIAPALHRDGLTSLLITYREDLGAPSSPDGFHHMGLTEWRDLEAAVRFALAHGARSLALVGYSMGGAIVAQFMERSPLASRVRGLVLDAPALSWKAILSFNATEMGFPSFGALPVEWAIGARIDADWGSLDALHHLRRLPPADPALPRHRRRGGADLDQRLLREGAPPLGHLLPRAPRAGHVESWNVDPALYERRLTRFLGRGDVGASS